MQISLLNSEMRRIEDTFTHLQQRLTDKDKTIGILSDIIAQFQKGRFIRLMVFLHKLRYKFSRTPQNTTGKSQ